MAIRLSLLHIEQTTHFIMCSEKKNEQFRENTFQDVHQPEEAYKSSEGS